MVNIYKDAYRLYLWYSEQRHLLRQVHNSIKSSQGEKAQLDALLKFYNSLIFQHVQADTFQSVIMHFLAILSINTQVRQLRLVNDFSYVLAGVLYCIHMIIVEAILLLDKQEYQNDSNNECFKQTRDMFLVDSMYSMVSKLLSLLIYSKHITMNHNNVGSVSQSNNQMQMSYKGNLIRVLRFRAMIRGVIKEAEDRLQANLIWSTYKQRFKVALDKL